MPDLHVNFLSKSQTYFGISGADETDIVVSIPEIDGSGRRAILGGEAKMYFELRPNKGSKVLSDIERLPSGPLRNATGMRVSKPIAGSSRSVPKGGRVTQQNLQGNLIVYIAPGQILQRALSFFQANPGSTDYRGFFTDAVHWFFCLVRSGEGNEDDYFYITEHYTFDLTSYNVCLLHFRVTDVI